MGGCSSSSKISAGVEEPGKGKKLWTRARSSSIHEPGKGTPAPPAVKKKSDSPTSPRGGRGHIHFDDGSSNAAVEAAVKRKSEDDPPPSDLIPGVVPTPENGGGNDSKSGSDARQNKQKTPEIVGNSPGHARNAETNSTIASIPGKENDVESPTPTMLEDSAKEGSGQAEGKEEAIGRAGSGTALPDAVETSDVPARPSVSFKMVPMGVSQSEARETFEAYVKRIPEELTKSFDCSFGCVEQSFSSSSAYLPVSLWLWKGHDADDSEGIKALGPKNADGLVVFRTSRSFTGSFCEVLHFSLTTPSWKDDLPGAIQALTSYIFKTTAGGSIRATLRYSVEEAGKFKILPDVERPFKELGFRWSRLSNSSDGARLQVVERARSAQRNDPPAQQELLDLKVSSFFVLPFLTGDAPSGEEEAPSSFFRGNCLLEAECLRRHALSEKDDPKPPSLEGEAPATDPESSVVAQLYRKLRRHSTLKMVRSNTVSKEAVLSDTEGQYEGLAPSAFPEGGGQALCGSFQIALNWKHSANCSTPGYLRVEVNAVGGDADDVIFLATEDDDIYVSIWKIDEQVAGYGQDELYRYCLEKSKASPPTKVGSDRPFDTVKLPECKLSLAGSSSAPPANLCSQAFGRPYQQLEVALSARKAAAGMVLPSEEEPDKVFELDRRFLMCAWHEKMEEIEAPLFVAVIDPNATA